MMSGYVRTAIEWAAFVIECLAVAVIVAGVAKVVWKRGTVRFLRHIDEAGALETYKQQLGQPLLLGLDLLVAGDVVRTVGLQPTTANVAALGLLILVRIGLSWSLVVEMTGRWPWQIPPEEHNERPSTGRETPCRPGKHESFMAGTDGPLPPARTEEATRADR